MQVLCIQLESKDPVEQIAKVCRRLSPHIAVGTDCIFVKISEFMNIYTERSILLRLQVLLKRYRSHFCVGFAEDIPTARAVAKYQAPHKLVLPIEALNEYYSPLHNAETMNTMIDILKRLNVHTIRDFLKMPLRLVSNRFGREGLMIAMRIRYAHHLPWPKWAPTSTVDKNVDVFIPPPIRKNLTFQKTQLTVLKDPSRIQRIGDYFVNRDNRWEVVYSEPIDQKWQVEDFKRDYFRIVTQTGAELLVFKCVASKEYFLHGISN